MKLLKNKIFIFIVLLIFSLFSIQFYFISSSYSRDTSSYVLLLEGKGELISSGDTNILKLEKKQKISSGDVVNTFGNSLAVIEWGDKSITRLGENTKVLIKENFTSDDLSKINISFELLKGKTWSNVISIFSGESYFKQEIKGVSAAVRGTVFEASYENDYIISHKHTVKVSNKDGKSIDVIEGKELNIKTFSLEDILNKINSSFQELNEKLDKEYIKQLREKFISSLNDTNPLNLVKNFTLKSETLNILKETNPKNEFEKFFKNLSDEKKQKVISYLNTLNQNINFENGENTDLYNLKLNTRENLINNTTDEEQKETLLNYLLFDLKNLKDNNKSLYEKTTNFIYRYKDLLSLPAENKEKFLKDILLLNGEDINLENMQQVVRSLDSLGQEKVNGLLDNALNFIKNFFK
ncbi:FecR domain-containing protein [Candidatus Gracilibacteria bacterium]|nr:FecR domain-containing protein [Candidatus Gracilibacteria bacterium]